MTKKTKKRGGRPLREDIDRDMIRKLAMIGCSHVEIAAKVGCARQTLEQRFRAEIEEGQSDGRTRAKAKIFQKGIVNGEFASLELYLINQCGWSRKPEVSVVTNVMQNNGRFDPRNPQEVKAQLLEAHKYILSEARRQVDGQGAAVDKNLQLPPG